jgi:hypothetical protein
MPKASLSSWIKRFLPRTIVNRGTPSRRARQRPNQALRLELLEQRDCPSTVILSDDHTTFLTGGLGAFTVQSQSSGTPSLSEAGPLPSGVTFTDNGDGTASLTGTPDAGTGGTYSFAITAHDASDGDATQPFLLTVDEAPSFNSANSATFGIGAAGTFTVTTGHDYPAPTTLTPSGTLPSGVTFTDNGDGTATLAGTPAAGTLGTYPLTITADNGVGSAATQDFTLTVLYGTSTSLTVTPAAPAFGQPMVFYAHVTPLAGSVPMSGTVTFYDGATPIGQAATVVGHRASLTTTAISAGDHVFTAVYSGSSKYAPSISGSVAKTVNQASSHVYLSPSTVAPVYGQPLTLTARVPPRVFGTVTPTGVIDFMDGATELSEVPLTNGVATLSNQLLSVGSHALTAVFVSDSGDIAGSTSLTLNENIRPARAKITLSAAPSPAVVGQDVTLTANVSVAAPGSADPSGTVTFKDGVNVLGTAPVVGGVATLTTSSLPAGMHTFMTTYGGDGNTTTTLNVARLQVNRASTSVDLTGSPTIGLARTQVTLTANVGVVAPGVATPSGKVALFKGGVLYTTGVVTGGVATLVTPKLAAGSYHFTAVYRGDLSSAPSSTTWDVTVNQAGQGTTTVGLSSDGSPSTLGSRVTFTATVDAASPAGTPTGSVSFFDGTRLLGNANLSGDLASLSTNLLASGTHSITATYNGDLNYNVNTSAPCTQIVQVGTTTTLTLSTPAPVYGQAVTFSARVSPKGYSASTPTGTVHFMDGATELAAVDLVNGVATLPNQTLSVGAHPLTAVYNSADPNFQDSTSAQVNDTIGQARSTIAFSASPSPAVYGQLVTLTANIGVASPGSAAPSGTVTFKDGLTVLGTASVVSGSASITTSSLAPNTHTLMAIYSGDTNVTSNQAVTKLVVSQASTAVDLSWSPQYSLAGQAATLTAQVSVVAPGVATPSGTVNFYLGSSLIGSGTISSGFASLVTQKLAVGNYTYTAVYKGDAHCLTSTSATWTVTVVNPPSITSLALASANIADASGTVSIIGGDTVTANVAGTDPAGRAITYTYEWMVDGVVVLTDHDLSATTDQLDLSTVPGGVVAGQSISVRVTPNNGVDGTAWTSSALTVVA